MRLQTDEGVPILWPWARVAMCGAASSDGDAEPFEPARPTRGGRAGREGEKGGDECDEERCGQTRLIGRFSRSGMPS
jgi:hypothetical protein